MYRETQVSSLKFPASMESLCAGAMHRGKRSKAWLAQRVFYLTPQVLMNDISSGACPARLVRCLVVDEAHKAIGNHAYCQVMLTAAIAVSIMFLLFSILM